MEGVPGDGILDRARANPRLTVAIAGGGLLLLGWIAWAIYVTSENGATAGLGVVIAWPALLSALALVSLPVVGAVLLVRRLRGTGEETASATDEEEGAEGADGDESSAEEEKEQEAEEADGGEAEDEDEEAEESEEAEAKSDDEQEASEDEEKEPAPSGS
jgi:hypothetical protein